MPSGLWHFALSVRVCSLVDNNNNNNNNTRACNCYYFAIFRIFVPYGNEWINIIKWKCNVPALALQADVLLY